MYLKFIMKSGNSFFINNVKDYTYSLLDGRSLTINYNEDNRFCNTQIDIESIDLSQIEAIFVVK